MSKVHVIGHVNPDTDAIASAMGYAWLLRSAEDGDYSAARAGPINPQTSWALKRLGLEPPDLLADASPRFGSVARRWDTVTPDRPLRDAWAIANRTGSVAPVVEETGKPYGLVTGHSLFDFLERLVGTHPDRQQMRLSEIFDQRCAEAADTGVPAFQAGGRIRDSLPRVLRQERDDFWVVDEQGRYVGVCRQPDLLNPPRLQLILVDHNEVGQAIASLNEADLLEVLDHHRLGNPPTHLPIRFRVDPVGSTSTLVSERIEDAGLSAPPPLAGMMLAGLLSDTLILTSPTTTDRDKEASRRLARWSFVGGSPLQGETVESFGKQILQAGAGLATRDPASVVRGDLKVYGASGSTFGIAQVEVADQMEVTDHLGPLSLALDGLREERGLDFAALMITDIVEGSSRILLRGAPAILDDLPYPRLPDGSLQARGIVSRKKQLLPVVLALLEG
jgi:manganese-dependent inorganic pyrophosphatase